jgi:hypothetical protein
MYSHVTSQNFGSKIDILKQFLLCIDTTYLNKNELQGLQTRLSLT